MSEKYRILSLDGGGLRGLITARLLEKLCDVPELKGWLDKTYLMAGTSTGGILALGLAAGKTPKEIFDLYWEKGEKIFDDSILDNVRDLGRLVGAEYSTDNLKKELDRVFGATKLAQLGRKVAIPTFDLDYLKPNSTFRTWKPKIFHNFKGFGSDGDASTADVALYTSAAPTYFPSANGFIDGGVFANNPSMIALAQAISSQNEDIAERAKLSDIVLLSIGTGVCPCYIEGTELDWGYAQWAPHLIGLMLDGVAGIADYQVQQLLGEQRYHRVQIVLKGDIPLDGVKKMDEMVQAAEAASLDATIDWLKNCWI